MEKVLFSGNIDNVKNICIYRIANIGDTVTAIPAMYQIHKRFPDARITLLSTPTKKGAPGAKEILKDSDWINKITIYYDSDISDSSKILKFIKIQRKKHFDYFIQLPMENTSFKTMIRNLFFAKLIGAQNATGFYISTLNVFAKTQSKYINFPNDVERLIEGLPWKNDREVEFPIGLNKKDETVLKNLLVEYDINENDPILAISFYGKGEAQRWSIKSFNEIAYLWTKSGRKVVVIGGDQQRNDGDKIINNLPIDKAYNFCGKLTLLQTMMFLKKAMLLLTVDTGTAHMASVTKTPCIELFSSYYLPGKWVAYGDNIVVIRKEIECSPCMSKTCKFGFPARCMKLIREEEVWRTIEKIFNLSLL